MCFCDDKYFKVTNVTTGRIKLYKRAASIARRFGGGKDWVFHCLGSERPILILNGERYKLEINKHPECQEVRRETIRRSGVRLGKITDRLRYMLPEHRQ